MRCPAQNIVRSLLLTAVIVFGVACGQRDQAQSLQPAPSASATGAVVIHEPAKLTSIETDKVDALGKPIRVACVTCHTARVGQKLPTSPDELRDFHQGLVFKHGDNTCASCHVLGAQDSLRLADGRLIPMREAMTLCGQCHGSQLRDYKKGAHGGMSGHWDLASGGRLRNHCVDCHDPHAPKFVPSTPVLPPRDLKLGPPIPHQAGPAIPKLSTEGAHP